MVVSSQRQNQNCAPLEQRCNRLRERWRRHMLERTIEKQRRHSGRDLLPLAVLDVPLGPGSTHGQMLQGGHRSEKRPFSAHSKTLSVLPWKLLGTRNSIEDADGNGPHRWTGRWDE